tara:strand:- start:213 stop:1625 length:1413 start_codon:yes stop_codon:yes gene_type:complete
MLMEMVEHLYDAIEPEVIGEEKEKPESPATSRRARKLRLPLQFPTEISVGQTPGTEDRKMFEMWMSGLPEGDLGAKLQAIDDFIKNPAGLSVSDTLSRLMFLNTFAFMLKEFNASVAGFLWEPFLAAMFGGKSIQVPTSKHDIADVQLLIDRGVGLQRVSLKILREEGAVGGSFVDLVNHFAAHPNEPMIYIVIKKSKDGKLMKFYEFPISQETFFNFIGHPAKIFKTDKVATKTYEGESNIMRKDFIAMAAAEIPEGYLKDKHIIVKVADTDEEVKGGNTRAIEPGVTYDVYARTIIKLPASPAAGVELSSNARHLWGKEAEYAEWFGRYQEYLNGKNPDFWNQVKKSAPGYANKKQFEISWAYAPLHDLTKNLGNLDISKETLDNAFAAGADSVGTDISDLFNSLADLVENVSRFFLIDCGDPTGEPKKCNPKDRKVQSSSGVTAIKNTTKIKEVVDTKIAPRVKETT